MYSDFSVNLSVTYCDAQVLHQLKIIKRITYSRSVLFNLRTAEVNNKSNMVM